MAFLSRIRPATRGTVRVAARRDRRSIRLAAASRSTCRAPRRWLKTIDANRLDRRRIASRRTSVMGGATGDRRSRRNRPPRARVVRTHTATPLAGAFRRRDEWWWSTRDLCKIRPTPRGAWAATGEASSKRRGWRRRGHDLVLLTSAELPDLDDDLSELADDVVVTPYAAPRGGRPAVPSALADDGDVYAPRCRSWPVRPALPPASSTTSFPAQFPATYLSSTSSVLANRARIEALRHYDLLLAISHSTEAACLRMLGKPPAIAVTGVGGSPPWGPPDASYGG